MLDLSSVERTQVPLDPDEPDGNSIRVYYSDEYDTPPMPSVTTIKSIREDPEKDDALEGWRQRYDGQSTYSRPWYKDQKVFKGYRGSIIHFAILDALADASGTTYFHEVGNSDYGYEEYYAEYALKKWSKKAPSANSKEVPYVPRNNKYDGEHAWDKAVRGMKWATRTFKSVVIDGDINGPDWSWERNAQGETNGGRVYAGLLNPEDVIGVEQYVFETAYGYGGQYDLLYEDDNGDTILSDLKTSSAIRFGHKLQSAAYKRAIEANSHISIDQTEVIRLDPDSDVVDITRSDDWDRSLDGLEHEFLGLCDKAWGVVYDDVLRRAQAQIEDEHESFSTAQA